MHYCYAIDTARLKKIIKLILKTWDLNSKLITILKILINNLKEKYVLKSKVYCTTCSLYSLILWVTLNYEIIKKNLDQYIYFSGSISFAWNGRMMVENKVFKEFKFTSSEIKDLRKQNINISS